MEHCNACKVLVHGRDGFCPLCGTALEKCEQPPARRYPVNEYPDLSGRMARYGFIWRLLIFVSILGCSVSVLVNLLATPGFLWCLIVLAAAVYLWVTVPPLLRNGVNYSKRVVWQVIFTSALVVALDFIIGYTGWSVDYVIPSLLAAGILAIGILVVFNRTNWAQYVLYQVLMGVFGLVPLVLYLVGIGGNVIMVLVTAGLAIATLLVTIVFGDRTVKTEFKKRFHV